MGLCSSKKQLAKPPPPRDELKSRNSNKKASDSTTPVAEEKTASQLKSAAKTVEPTADMRTVLVVKAVAAAAAAAAENDEENKRPVPEEQEVRPVVVSRVPVRTSRCTKEELEAILIQCGRLSRISSGKVASSETMSGNRRVAGSKRSYDFDHERRGGGAHEECDWDGQGEVSRPSPHRTRPERKWSGSGGGGSRRVSRSPGRRSEGVPAAASSCRGERVPQQPAKMMSVPAREKGRALSPAAASAKRCVSPRSCSPARGEAAGDENVGGQATQTPSLSPSSSRRAEQSPYRRNPMAELDENSLLNNNINPKPQKKSTESAVAVQKKATERAKVQIATCWAVKDKPDIMEEAVASDTKASSAKTNATPSVSIVAESLNTRAGPGSRSSRRSSRDFDHNPNSYATQLLKGIQNYHKQNTVAVAPAFSLPACVSKACSILEAVADLNSSSENKSYEMDHSADDNGSMNGRYGKTGAPVAESEAAVKDDLMVLSLHQYVSVRDSVPQESAGSNNFTGKPWTCSWEPNSVDSTGRRTWTASQSNNGSALDQSWQSKQRQPLQEPSGRPGTRSSGNVQRGHSVRRGSSGATSGRSDAWAVLASS